MKFIIKAIIITRTIIIKIMYDVFPLILYNQLIPHKIIWHMKLQQNIAHFINK